MQGRKKSGTANSNDVVMGTLYVLFIHTYNMYIIYACYTYIGRTTDQWSK